jgi:hypothetical protein
MPRALRQSEKPLPPEIARLVEGIALALAQEHHALEISGNGLFNPVDGRSDRTAAE